MTSHQTLWSECLTNLQDVLDSQEFMTWVRPLRVDQSAHQDALVLLAPNTHIRDYVNESYSATVSDFLQQRYPNQLFKFQVKVDSSNSPVNTTQENRNDYFANNTQILSARSRWKTGVNSNYTFDNFVQGQSNQFAHAAAIQVAKTPGVGANPLFIYGRVGLGKTHLMCAVGNEILSNNPEAKVYYSHSSDFVKEMIKALQNNKMDEFKAHYHSVDVLLIDDIQFIAGKDKTQEEFFHTFNHLFEGKSQMILTSDRFPKEIDDISERLRSRFSWGLTVFVEPPELETRVIILKKKAEEREFELSDEVAFFIAQNIHGNVRDLEGALNGVIATAQFLGQGISIEVAKMALRDQLAVQARLITIENIQKVTADYFGLKLVDILSKKRNRSIARPRQMAMALSKELTKHSLPEIGDAFGGRDHTTVLHACRKIVELRRDESKINSDWNNLINTLRN